MVTFNENDDNGDNYENDNEEEEEYYDNKIIDDNWRIFFKLNG